MTRFRLAMTVLSQQLTTLDKEISQLNELIETKRRQQALVTEADQLSSQALESLKSALAMVPDAASDIRASILSLFDDSDSNGDEGNDESKSPTSSDNGSKASD